MSNVLTIAGKELRSYFASPIAYVVIGLFALLYGFFFNAMLNAFVEQGLQAGMMGGGPPMNINEWMRWPMQNANIVLLFLLPMVTMRSFAEEKRTGTFELLLTAPLTDLQIIAGKFLGAVALFLLMLAVTLFTVVVLFIFGSPEWKPIVTGYLGLLLVGSSYIAVGLFISSLTRNQIVAAVITFTTFLLLLVVGWFAQSAGPIGREVLSFLSITDHFDDFVKGIVDTKHLVYFASFIGFGLFLTVRAVDSERWRG